MWRILVVFLLFVLLLVSCKQDSPARNSTIAKLQDVRNNLVILRIQDSVYFNSDFEKYLKLSIGEEYKNLSEVSLSRLVDNFIEEKILLDAARDQGMLLTWEEKKQYLAKQTNESVREEKNRPLNEDEVRLLLDRLLVEKYTYSQVKNIEVEEEEIKDYYAKNKREFLLAERVKVSQILLSSEEMAVELLENLKNSTSEDFKRIAQKESIGVEASRGGEMGVFEMGQLPYEMEKVIFSLKEGEVSLVFESSYGFHIFRLDAKYEPELTPEEKASSSIRMKILSQKIKDHLSQHIEDLKDSLEWDFYPQNLYFHYQRISDESVT
jgi:parvulin-like peptidyl-prolyl isomerase